MNNQVPMLSSPDPGTCLARLGYEIRTSMHLMLGLAEILLESNLGPGQREYVNVLRNSADRLLSTSGDIVALGTDEGSPTVHEDFDLLELLNQTTELLQSLAGDSESGLHLQLKVEPMLERRVWGNRRSFEELLIAIISAVIRTGASGSVTLTAGPGEIRGRTRFTISMPPLDSVIRESTQKAEALDIRFALAAQLAVKLGAELQMDTTPAATIVLFSAQFVPLAVGDAVGDLDSAPSTAAKPLQVLLAEDTADSQFLMTAYLKGQNCTVDIAADGAVAVRKVQERQYDIVFMDLDMPELDGVEATRRIREYEHSGNRPAMPIIALTAHTNDEIVRLCADTGFSAYMAKPVTKKAILGALSSYATRGRDIHLGNAVVAN